MAHEPGDMLVKVLGPLPRDRALWTYTSGAIVIPVKPLRIDRSGRILVPAAGTTPNGDFVQYVFVMGSDGVVVDSIAPAGDSFEPPSLEFRLRFPFAGRSTSTRAVPLTGVAPHTARLELERTAGPREQTALQRPRHRT